MIKVVCAIIHEKGKFLVCQRSEKMSQPLVWEFPGGKVMARESNEEALVREIYEELAIRIKVNSYCGENIFHYPEKSIQLKAYSCARTTKAPIVLTEHKAYQWLDKKELNQLNWAPADIPFLEKL